MNAIYLARLSVLAWAVNLAAGGWAAAQPAAPALLQPLNAASVQVPLTISWSATLSPSEISGGYNWQVSRSPSFSPLALADSTSPAITQDVVSGLPAGTYFWRVQAVDVVGQSPWSQLLARTRHHILIVGSVLVVNCDAEIVCATVKN